jgi:peptidoglycan-associated lipoprotein
MHMRRAFAVMTALLLAVTVTACSKKKPPVARPVPPPPAATDTTAGRPPGPPEPGRESPPIPPEPIASNTLTDIDTINKNSPFTPVFFQYDSAEIDGLGQQTLNQNSEILKKNQTWVITIEGHADERGTAEYNLALGERRAAAARTYLISLGIPAERLKMVSYGKEFPFDPAHNESAWSKNRRAQFVVTSK